MLLVRKVCEPQQIGTDHYQCPYVLSDLISVCNAGAAGSRSYLGHITSLVEGLSGLPISFFFFRIDSVIEINSDLESG